MPKLEHRGLDNYKHDHASGRGRVWIQGKYHYLPGPYNSPESLEAYYRLLGKLQRGEIVSAPANRSSDEPTRQVTAPCLLTVVELVELYKSHCETYYRQDGKPTGEHLAIKYALRPLLDLCPAVLAADFRPRDLKEVRSEMIARGWCRRHINQCVRRIRAIFTWAVEEQLIDDEGVAGALKMVKALKEGRSEAREKPDVEPATDEQIAVVLPLVSEVAADVIQFIR
jgi:hypothetical protein